MPRSAMRVNVFRSVLSFILSLLSLPLSPPYGLTCSVLIWSIILYFLCGFIHPSPVEMYEARWCRKPRVSLDARAVSYPRMQYMEASLRVAQAAPLAYALPGIEVAGVGSWLARKHRVVRREKSKWGPGIIVLPPLPPPARPCLQ